MQYKVTNISSSTLVYEEFITFRVLLEMIN